MRKSETAPKSARNSRFPYSEAEIRLALARWASNAPSTGPDLPIIMALAKAGANKIQGSRKGGGRVRKPSTKVTRRLEAILDTYRHLTPNLQAHPTCEETLRQLGDGAKRALGLRVIARTTVVSDVGKLGVIFRLVREGIIPLGNRPPKPEGLSPRTLLEMDAGRRAAADIARHPPSASTPLFKFAIEFS
jgi:hypothetical protein